MTYRQVSYGGGVNSCAMLIELVNRKVHFDIVLFADTIPPLRSAAARAVAAARPPALDGRLKLLVNLGVEAEATGCVQHHREDSRPAEARITAATLWLTALPRRHRCGRTTSPLQRLDHRRINTGAGGLEPGDWRIATRPPALNWRRGLAAPCGAIATSAVVAANPRCTATPSQLRCDQPSPLQDQLGGRSETAAATTCTTAQATRLCAASRGSNRKRGPLPVFCTTSTGSRRPTGRDTERAFCTTAQAARQRSREARPRRSDRTTAAGLRMEQVVEALPRQLPRRAAVGAASPVRREITSEFLNHRVECAATLPSLP